VEDTYAEYLKNLNTLMEGMGNRDYKALIELLEKANCILLEAKQHG
jgi:hypothetical protein